MTQRMKEDKWGGFENLSPVALKPLTNHLLCQTSPAITLPSSSNQDLQSPTFPPPGLRSKRSQRCLRQELQLPKLEGASVPALKRRSVLFVAYFSPQTMDFPALGQVGFSQTIFSGINSLITTCSEPLISNDKGASQHAVIRELIAENIVLT